MASARLSYDPWEIPRELRTSTLVGRDAVLAEILAAVAEQAGHATIQHYLLLGPRGIGKTTMLLEIRDRLRSDPALAARWSCVQLREEEYFVRTLRDLLDLVVHNLAADEQIPGAVQLAQRVQAERDSERSLALALDGLDEICAATGRRILLLIDNFDRLFPQTHRGAGKKASPQNEWRALRKLLSTKGFLMVIGASVRLFEEIASYDQALFNFFTPVELASFSEDETTELLRRRAIADGDQGFLRAFAAIEGKVRAITFMTGGNPRLAVMLYDVLRQREMLPVVSALRETVAGLTPMLKHVLDDMPRQQSKTLDALVRLEGPAPPSQVAKLARLSLNVVTTQLGRLRESRFVVAEAAADGKQLYRVSDPMFRTWYQIRYLRPPARRIELFVDFLRAVFTDEDRRRVLHERWGELQTCAQAGHRLRLAEVRVGIEYYAASLEDPAEREQQFRRLAEGLFDAGEREEAARLLLETTTHKRTSRRLLDADGYRALGDLFGTKGDHSKARMTHEEALARNPSDQEARLGLAEALAALGKLEEAKASLDDVLKSRKLDRQHLTRALITRGRVGIELGDVHGGMRDLTAAIDLPGAPVDQVAKALFGRGISKGILGDDSQGAIADYTVAIDLPGAPVDVVAKALFGRGISKGILGDSQGALADYTAAIDLPGAPVDQVATALVNRGMSKRVLGDSPGAIADYTAAIDLPEMPTDLFYGVTQRLIAALLGQSHEEAVRRMAELHEREPRSASLEHRLEARIAIVLDVAGHSLEMANKMLEVALRNDPADICERLAFLRPALELARTGDETALASLPDKEREAARRIAGKLPPRPAASPPASTPAKPTAAKKAPAKGRRSAGSPRRTGS